MCVLWTNGCVDQHSKREGQEIGYQAPPFMSSTVVHSRELMGKGDVCVVEQGEW